MDKISAYDKYTYLEKLPYYKNLTEEQKALVQEHSYIHEYQKGQVICGYGNDCVGQLVVISGSLRVYLSSEEGREITLFSLQKGEICVLSAACIIRQITFEAQVVAEDNTTLLIISSSVISKIMMENIYLRCYSYATLTERFSAAMQTMQRILFMNFDARLASFLINEHEKTGAMQLYMTHEEIAKHTSSAREVVARALKRFATENIVEMKRGYIKLVDVDKLKQIIDG